MPPDTQSVMDKINNKIELEKSDIVYILDSSDDHFIQQVISTADKIRHENVGDSVHLRGLLEFSNYCKRNCLYCGLRKDNRNVSRYRIMPGDIVDLVKSIASFNIKTVVLQSGEDNFYNIGVMTDIVRRIKQQTDIAVTLSIGEKTKDEYRALKLAGADRFLLRHETASPQLYRKLHPDSDFKERIQCIDYLFETGFQVGIGSMTGLPYQTADDLAQDILLLRKYQPDMIGIGPFIPHGDTPLGKFESGTIDLTLRMVALARIVCPKSNIPATTAAGTVDPYGREKALLAGANVVMPNFTPLDYRKKYTIYPNKRCIDEEGNKCNYCIRAMITGLGRTVDTGYGHGASVAKPADKEG